MRNVCRPLKGTGLLFVAALLAAPACSPNNNHPTPWLSGTVESSAPITSAKVVVLWGVIDADDYSYKLGEGLAHDDVFTLAVPGAVPAEALNSGHTGVAALILTDPDVAIPEGKVDAPDTLRPLIRGMSLQNALIWRQSTTTTTFSWEDAFPAGLSCAQCAPPEDGGTFHRWTPVDCSLLKIQAPADPAASCNWT